MTDPGAATCDASVDLEILVPENDADVMAIATRHLVPTVCSNWMRLDDGQLARAAETRGDGACSLHALWGLEISFRSRNEYYCEDARANIKYRYIIYIYI